MLAGLRCDLDYADGGEDDDDKAGGEEHCDAEFANWGHFKWHHEPEGEKHDCG